MGLKKRIWWTCWTRCKQRFTCHIQKNWLFLGSMQSKLLEQKSSRLSYFHSFWTQMELRYKLIQSTNNQKTVCWTNSSWNNQRNQKASWRWTRTSYWRRRHRQWPWQLLGWTNVWVILISFSQCPTMKHHQLHFNRTKIIFTLLHTKIFWMIGNYHSITFKEQKNKSSHIQSSTETLAKNGTFTSDSIFRHMFHTGYRRAT